MLYWLLLPAALLLSLERLTYAYVAHRPEAFRARCRGPVLSALGDDPVTVVHKLFYVFKGIQTVVFLGWCSAFGGTLVPWPAATPLGATLGALLIAAGSGLSLVVFRLLGPTGVFYGRELGYEVPWIRGLPFSVVPHPQYVGTVMTIWGFFLIMRFPHPDWWVLPVLETLFYLLGSRYEP